MSAMDDAAAASSSQTTISVQASTAFAPVLVHHNVPQVSTIPLPVAETAAPETAMSHAQMPSRTHKSRSQTVSDSDLRVGNCSLDEMLLSIPHGLVPGEHKRRREALRDEIRYQESHPPILPPTKVKDLPPKPIIPDFLKFPDGITDAQRLDIESRNNEIAAQHQKVDRQRNNQAAKKSRQARLEALSNTRVLLNEKAAECAWFRMKVLALGGSTEDWGMVSTGVKARLVKEIDGRVKTIEVEVAEGKKREEARKRADRNRRRAEAKKEGEQSQQQQLQYSEQGFWGEETSLELFGLKRKREDDDEGEDEE